MDGSPPQDKLIKRVDNFYWDSKLIKEKLTQNSECRCKLYDLINEITSMTPIKNVGTAEILCAMFPHLYSFAVRQDPAFMVFHRESPFYDDLFETCLYTMLCMFLHNTKRVKGKSLRRFVYDNSPSCFNEKSSQYYYSFEDSADSALLNEETTFRKYRHRRLLSKPVYTNRSEWAGMAVDSEYEWSLYYDLKIESDVVQDTYKRIGNLYNGIHEAIQSPKNENYRSKLEAAYQKFLSKLSKIKYENYLELQRTLFAFLNEDTKYHGMNLYRLEKEMRPSIITYEVNRLLKCNNRDEECAVIQNSILLHDIWFPRLYVDFASSPSVTAFCAKWFLPFLNHVIVPGCLILDELIDKNYFGENWESSFLNIVNDISARLFSLESIDWTVTKESQNKFEQVMAAYVRVLLSANGNSQVKKENGQS